MDIQKFENYRKNIVGNCSKVIVGQEDVLRLVVVSFICGGHVLLEDVPGTGKTMLLKSFSKTVGGGFSRIQFTPDLLPSDLTGINFYNQKLGEFEFRRGPLFANIILADEINRATPRTQSSLLEAMEERQITVDGVTYVLEKPFMVMATQNPLESYGTFPLPEAQIDRFFMRLSLGRLARNEEIEVIARPSTEDILHGLTRAVTAEETEYVQSNYHNVTVSDEVTGYIMDIIEGTRSERRLTTGVSTRGAIALFRAAKACAAINGKSFVTPEDVLFVAPHVLAHRLGGSQSSVDDKGILANILKEIPVPLEG
ncbi:MAG: AAA family ATPase [Firmicutes bacterium]|nr:AAA family ATPase [Bacillota bacterium]